MPAAADVSLNGAPVAVTGAGGFIGSHVVEHLLTAGARVRALVGYRSDRSLGALGWLPAAMRQEVELVRGDVRDPETVEALVAGQEVVLHLAALVAIPHSYSHPRHVFAVNVDGTMNVALACLRAGVRRLVQTSTSEVYGTAQTLPITEEHPLHPQSPYAASKVAADQLVLSLHRSLDLPVVVLRPFNTYGPRQSTRAVLPTIAVQALAGGPVRLGSLTPRRDMTFVEDTARAFLAAARCPTIDGQVLQLGTGRDHSVAEMVAAVGRAVGRELEVQTDPARTRPATSEVWRLLGDPGAMHQATGWSPVHDLDSGVAALVAWLRRHPDAFAAGEYAI